MCWLSKVIAQKVMGQPDIFQGHDPTPEYMVNAPMPTLTKEQVIGLFEYRIGIHDEWLKRIIKDPSLAPTYGDVNFQYWAMEGYENAIHYLKQEG